MYNVDIMHVLFFSKPEILMQEEHMSHSAYTRKLWTVARIMSRSRWIFLF